MTEEDPISRARVTDELPALVALGTVCRQWQIIGFREFTHYNEVVKATSGALRGTLSDTEKKQFDALMRSSQFWASGRLGIETLTPEDIILMEVLERKLFEFFVKQPPSSMEKKLSHDLMIAIRRVKSELDQREWIAKTSSRDSGKEKER